ncbi:MAG: nucleotidyltransferase family protein [Chlamydiota bacterium]
MQRLLEAALFDKPRALASWNAYLAATDLQKADHAETTLFPFVYRNLREQSHPICKSTYRHTWAFNQHIWAKTRPVLCELLAAGVEKIALLKGMAMILDYYRDFGVRIVGDIDILIDPLHLPLTYAVLTKSGWRCAMPRFDPHSHHRRARWNAAGFVHPSGLNLDVHWSLLLETAPANHHQFLDKLSPGIQAADPTDLFFQTCIHGYKKSAAPLIRWVPDALTLLRQSAVDFSRLFQLAHAFHLTLPLSRALGYLSSHFDAAIPPFCPKPCQAEVREFNANARGRIYLAGYYRARLYNHSLAHYLQQTANLPSAWLIPLYGPFWLLKRLYRLIARVRRKVVAYFFDFLLLNKYKPKAWIKNLFFFR